MSRTATFLTMLAPLVLACALGILQPAYAAPVVVPFSGSGLVTPQPSFNPNLSPWPLEGLPQFSTFTVDGAAGWQLHSRFDVVVDFTQGPPIPGDGRGTFRLFEPLTGDELSGSFDSFFDPSNGPFGGYDLVWVVGGGAGRFAGASGGATSVTVFTSNPLAGFPVSFTDAGRFELQGVAEPSGLALASLALAAVMGFGRRRRR